VVILW
jgi:hypothetical protein